jgi:tRNA acetyltransferase TAN1
VLKDFNLLVSSARGNEREAGSELRYLLKELKDPSVQTGLTPISGLTVAKSGIDPVEVIRRLKPKLSERPWQFRYILKIKPIMRVVQSEIGRVCEAVDELASEVGEGETFRVSVQKRHSRLVSKDLIDQVAKRIPRKVDLKKPSKVILVEVMGDLTGVSVLSTEDVLAVESEKRLSRSRLRVARIVPISAA